MQDVGTSFPKHSGETNNKRRYSIRAGTRICHRAVSQGGEVTSKTRAGSRGRCESDSAGEPISKPWRLGGFAALPPPSSARNTGATA